MLSIRKQYAVVLLVTLAVGYLFFLRTESTREHTLSAAPTFTAEDHQLMRLVSRRDADGIIAALASEQIPIDYAVGGKMDMFTIATSRKLPELLAFLLQQEDTRISSMARTFVFLRDEEHPADSAAIARMYLEHTYDQDRMVLDIDDSVGLLMIMCSLQPYSPAEVDALLDGFAIHAPESVVDDAVNAFAGDPPGREDAAACLRQVLQHVTALPA